MKLALSIHSHSHYSSLFGSRYIVYYVDDGFGNLSVVDFPVYVFEEPLFIEV